MLLRFVKNTSIFNILIFFKLRMCVLLYTFAADRAEHDRGALYDCQSFSSATLFHDRRLHHGWYYFYHWNVLRSSDKADDAHEEQVTPPASVH